MNSDSATPSTSARASCDLCGQRDFQPVSRHDRRGGALRTVVCRVCGLVRHWHVPSEQQLQTFYASQYREAYHGEVTPSARRVMRAWQNGQRIHELLQQHIQPPATVLEVGAGIGCTVKVFEQHGFAASGIEPHRGFQKYAAHTLRAQVENRDLFEGTELPSSDLLLLVHVIEHFRSPRRALNHMQRMLKPGGLLYMECPNLGAPFTVRQRLFHLAHIHNFTPQTLNALAAATGFELVAWIHRLDDPNLAGLWRRKAAADSVAAPGLSYSLSYSGNYEATLSALRRYNWFTYHCRTTYLRSRAVKVRRYLHERMTAKRFVSQLIRSIHDGDAHSAGQARRQAA